jgi:cytosine/adenosine deaminase-related metal-dependent hydrolase
MDVFEEMRAVEMHERLLSHERGHFAPAELLRMATINGHRALGWADCGEIAVGREADLVTVRDDTRRTAGVEPNQLVFAAGAPDITDVVVGGRHLVHGGVHDLGPVDDFVNEAMTMLRERR